MNPAAAETQPPWHGVRFDSFTFRLAMKHIAAAKPRVLYLALDETDDWAHDRNYTRTLEALARIDGYLKELWTWVQAQPEYRGRQRLRDPATLNRHFTPVSTRCYARVSITASVRCSETPWKHREAKLAAEVIQ